MPSKRNLGTGVDIYSINSSKKSKRNRNKRLKNNYYVKEELVEGLFQYNETNYHYDNYKQSFQPKEEIKPRSVNQHIYNDLLNKNDVSIVACVGPAGTGKTLLATINGINHLRNNMIDKIIITRPLVSADEDIGYLPGNLEDKMAPWTRPMMDIFYLIHIK
mgnify:CR=1 FL=1